MHRTKFSLKIRRPAAFLVIIALGFIAVAAQQTVAVRQTAGEKVTASNHAFASPSSTTVPASATTSTVTPSPITIPSAKILPMAYTVQAPNKSWSINEESCEEAALLMYHDFIIGRLTFNGSADIPADTALAEFTKMKAWEVTNYGAEPDLNIAAWAKFAKDYYGHNGEVFTGATKEDIEREIALGHPVVVPVMTHALDNPHYGAKSVYHLLVIKGYKDDGVITNDAGISEGENYFYTWNVLFQAIDAQTAARPDLAQGRVMAILTK